MTRNRADERQSPGLRDVQLITFRWWIGPRQRAIKASGQSGNKIEVIWPDEQDKLDTLILP